MTLHQPPTRELKDLLSYYAANRGFEITKADVEFARDLAAAKIEATPAMKEEFEFRYLGETFENEIIEFLMEEGIPKVIAKLAVLYFTPPTPKMLKYARDRERFAWHGVIDKMVERDRIMGAYGRDSAAVLFWYLAAPKH